MEKSLLTVKIGGREYPLRHVSTCRVCTSPFRLDIERALVAGHSYKNILSLLPDDEDRPSTSDMRKHVRDQHLPLPDIQKRALIERRAEQIGRSIEEGQEILVDYVGVNEMMIQQGFQDLQDGKIAMKASDLISALKLRHDIERTQEGTVSDEMWAEALMEYLSITKRILPPELWDRFGAELQGSPVLQAIAQKMNQQQEIES